MKTRTKLSLIALILATLLLGVYIGYSATPTNPIWISSGVYPGAPSYTVWREGSNYFAKDSNGQIDYSGTNASLVINNALTATSRGTVELASGYFIITDPLIFTQGVSLRGQGPYATIINNTDATGKDALFIGDFIWYGSIENLRITGNANSGNGIYLNGTRRGILRNCHFEENGVNGIAGDGNFKFLFENIETNFNDKHGININNTLATVGELTFIRINSASNTIDGFNFPGVANIDLIDSTGESNGRYGMYVSGSPIFVSGSNFEANTQHQVHVGAQGSFVSCYFHSAPTNYYGLSLWGTNRTLALVAPRFASNWKDILLGTDNNGSILMGSTPSIDQLDITIGSGAELRVVDVTAYTP